MDKVVNYVMTQLFQMAEYVCSKSPFMHDDNLINRLAKDINRKGFECTIGSVPLCTRS